MSEGFLGRWARRKQDARAGRSLEEPVVPEVMPAAPPPASSAVPAAPDAAPASSAESAPPPPTLDDVRVLTPESDFKPFMAREVAPEVKNAAMKKLFADPHFNVMDGLDIYIDDYSKPDPLPAPMLRKLASAQFLNLFDEDKKEQPTTPAAPAPSTAPEATQPDPAAVAATPISQDNHADPDLQLQPDHAAGAQGSGRGAQ